MKKTQLNSKYCDKMIKLHFTNLRGNCSCGTKTIKFEDLATNKKWYETQPVVKIK